MSTGMSEKRKGKPHNPLSEVKKLIHQGRLLLSKRIALGAVGFTMAGVEDFLLELEQKDFHISNEDYYDSGVWQDAYRKKQGDGIELYVKFKISKDKVLIVTSFKKN